MRRAFAVISGGNASRVPKGTPDTLPEGRGTTPEERKKAGERVMRLLEEVNAAHGAGDKRRELLLAIEIVNLRIELRGKMPHAGVHEEDITGLLLGTAAMASRCVELGDEMQRVLFAGIMRDAAEEYLRLNVRRLNGELASGTVRPYLSQDEIRRIREEERNGRK